jgi:hypothetical protein
MQRRANLNGDLLVDAICKVRKIFLSGYRVHVVLTICGIEAGILVTISTVNFEQRLHETQRRICGLKR